MSTVQDRRPAGIPTGGQFAPTTSPEANLSLEEEPAWLRNWMTVEEAAAVLTLSVVERPISEVRVGDVMWAHQTFVEVLRDGETANSWQGPYLRLWCRPYAGTIPNGVSPEGEGYVDFGPAATVMVVDKQSPAPSTAASTAAAVDLTGDVDLVDDDGSDAELAGIDAPEPTTKLSGTETITGLFPNGEPNKLRRGHMFLPGGLVDQIPELYSTEETPLADKTIYIHYFTGSSDWHIAELERGTGLAFGHCDLGVGFPEWGYVNLVELAEINTRSGAVVERDKWFKPQTAREAGLVK